MKRKNGFWGAGRGLLIINLSVLVLLFIVEKLFLDKKFSFNFKGRLIIALALSVSGFFIYVYILKKLKSALKKGILLKNSFFRVVRHPAYSLWLYFFIPAFLLFTGNAIYSILFLTYILSFKLYIKDEEEELVSKFGEEYLVYRENVPQIFPYRFKIYDLFLSPEFTKKYNEDLFILKDGYSNFFIYCKGDVCIAIDSGIGGKLWKKETLKLKAPVEKVKAVFLTHSDFDHTGGIKYFHEPDIYFGKEEEKIIKGETPRFYGFIFQRKEFKNYKLVFNEKVFVGDIEIEAIYTPGHTPGHTVYIVDGKYMFTGDLVRIVDNKIMPFFRFLSWDHRILLDSLSKVRPFFNNYTIFTAHSGILEPDEEKAD